ncbi:SDR family oxidoreductase [Amorphus orientalis]|uniref:Nucleoside-diphosphate-sugar epimerase n=1 Tax=Amorphus orientalis TaxID=649198 RepID=A0AAE4AUC0_9HYPH|nr:SDR family oxidoreductase [Amorphus orientalis]MDQ0317220.1 nucleoside-diphosphate-sugar epimerase [Amorphus orientalis]
MLSSTPESDTDLESAREAPARRLVCLGLGYSANALVELLDTRKVDITGTTRSPEKADAMHKRGIRTILFDGERESPALADAIRHATHLLVSAAPTENGDPFLWHHERDIVHAEGLKWIGYLSSVGVYGNHDGAVVDERSVCQPQSERSMWRLAAETAWMSLGHRTHVPVSLLRLAGIYGPGRNALKQIADGRARRIIKPGQVFNRIHVDDIARTIERSMDRPASRIYNVVDNKPSPPQDVIEFAAELMGAELPPAIDFDEADLSPMARTFYGEVKVVSNRRLHDELGVRLEYPTYREGLRALWDSGRWKG